MDWLRKIVSGKRIRYDKEGYNLDITYITPRILAMSFPASGLETMYRNNINDVTHFQLTRILGSRILKRKT
jgi:phosphatidylinositol-3,4,5-trisphosphate 3-phosphatase/dual-specificity protein phosphatase PTEN